MSNAIFTILGILLIIEAIVAFAFLFFFIYHIMKDNKKETYITVGKIKVSNVVTKDRASLKWTFEVDKSIPPESVTNLKKVIFEVEDCINDGTEIDLRLDPPNNSITFN